MDKEILVYFSKGISFNKYVVVYQSKSSYMEKGKRHYLARYFYTDKNKTSDVFVLTKSAKYGRVISNNDIPAELRKLIILDLKTLPNKEVKL
jgi:hypothetical protein